MNLSIKLTEDLSERIRLLAEAQNTSADSLMTEALETYVRAAEKNLDFQAEAIAALKHYQETGQHLTSKDMDEWLATWGTAQETPAPECHG